MLDKWENDIESLKIKARAADADAKIQYVEKIEELEAQKSSVESKLNKISTASEKAWDDMAQGIDNALSELDDATQKAIQQLT